MRSLTLISFTIVVFLFQMRVDAALPEIPPTSDVVKNATAKTFLHDFVIVHGDEFWLPKPEDTKATVLFFLGHDCPISNSYAKEISRISDEYTPKQIAFTIVYADADLKLDDARKHAKEYGFTCLAMLDPQMVWARATGATVKPEVAVLGSKRGAVLYGEVLYLGRIDDRYIDFGKRREQLTSHDLRDVLNAVLAGKKIAVPKTKAIGCDIDFPPVTNLGDSFKDFLRRKPKYSDDQPPLKMGDSRE